MPNPEFDLENQIHKLLSDFKIQTDHLISIRRPDLIIINNKRRTYRNVEFAVPANHGVELKESKREDKYLVLAWEMKNYGTWKWLLYQL